jgi:hypothetical protein
MRTDISNLGHQGVFIMSQAYSNLTTKESVATYPAVDDYLNPSAGAAISVGTIVNAMVWQVVGSYPDGLCKPQYPNTVPLHSIVHIDLSPRRIARFVKCTSEIVLVVATAPLWLLLFSLLALCVWLQDGAHPLFLQKRIGRGGRTFTMVKLRTMAPNAAEVLRTKIIEENSLKDRKSVV